MQHMKRILFLGFIFSISFLTLTQSVYAFDHGYKRRTENVYCMVREDLYVYEDPGDPDHVQVIPPFSGIILYQKGENWCEISYEKDGRTIYGYITSSDYAAICCEYDAAEKQVMANGNYHISYHGITSNYSHQGNLSLLDTNHLLCAYQFFLEDLSFKMIYVGDGKYRIKRTDTKDFLCYDPMITDENSSKLWGTKKEAGTFILTRVGNYYGIQDSVTNRFLAFDENGLLSFMNGKANYWRFVRKDKAINSKVLRVFDQYDPEWASYYYGEGTNDDPLTNTFSTSACGIFSTMNMIYSLTGHKANPYKLADYAVECRYRIEDNGTDSAYFAAAAKKFGPKYGFKSDGSSGSIEELRDKLRAGDCAIVYLPGHYACIVDYNEKTHRYLLLDSYHLPKRQTSAYGDWVSQSDLESGDLTANMFFYFKRTSY